MKTSYGRQAVMGLSDGMMSPLGVLLYLLGHQALIFPTAVCGAVSAMCSMGGSEWLSEDDPAGPGGSLAMATATGAGAIFPALPFAFTTGPLAIASSVVICVLIGFIVACLRPGSLLVRLAQTYTVLSAIFAVVLAVALIFPGGGA